MLRPRIQREDLGVVRSRAMSGSTERLVHLPNAREIRGKFYAFGLRCAVASPPHKLRETVILTDTCR